MWNRRFEIPDSRGTSFTTSFSSDTGARLMDSLNRGTDRGNVSNTRRHRMTANLVFDLPFGKGRALLRNAGGVLQGVAGG